AERNGVGVAFPGRSATPAGQAEGSAVTAMRHKRWDEHDDEFIRDNWARLGGPRVAERLGRTLTATQQRAHMLGVKSRPGVPTREEFECLCAEYTIPEIARQCGVS